MLLREVEPIAVRVLESLLQQILSQVIVALPDETCQIDEELILQFRAVIKQPLQDLHPRLPIPRQALYHPLNSYLLPPELLPLVVVMQKCVQSLLASLREVLFFSSNCVFALLTNLLHLKGGSEVNLGLINIVQQDIQSLPISKLNG